MPFEDRVVVVVVGVCGDHTATTQLKKRGGGGVAHKLLIPSRLAATTSARHEYIYEYREYFNAIPSHGALTPVCYTKCVCVFVVTLSSDTCRTFPRYETYCRHASRVCVCVGLNGVLHCYHISTHTQHTKFWMGLTTPLLLPLMCFFNHYIKRVQEHNLQKHIHTHSHTYSFKVRAYCRMDDDYEATSTSMHFTLSSSCR